MPNRKTSTAQNGAAIFLLAVAALAFLAPARTQQVTVSQLDGYVTDPSGGAIAGADVRVVEFDRSQVHQTTTDSTGRYQLPNLPVGRYQLEISFSGFKTYVGKGIQLDAASTRTISVTLEVGAVTEKMEVAANSAQVETKDSAIAQRLSTARDSLNFPSTTETSPTC